MTSIHFPPSVKAHNCYKNMANIDRGKLSAMEPSGDELVFFVNGRKVSKTLNIPYIISNNYY